MSRIPSNIIVDSHCHPQFPQYEKDREEMIQRAFNEGVFMICVGTDLETSKKGIELAQKYSGPPSPNGFSEASIWATVGLHPNDISSIKYPADAKALADRQVLSVKDYEKLLNLDKIVAVGEVGLDYYRTPEPEKQEKQKEFFGQFLDLAIQHDKPVIIHSRDAAKGTTGRVHQDLLNILNTKYLIHNTKLRGVAHSFTGNIDEAKKYLDLGFYLGFNGIITFPPSHKATAGTVPGMYDEVVRYVPLDRILLETDAPYLTPEPYRGQRNEPAHVMEVVKKIAELKNEPLEKVVEQTTKNCKNLFKLNVQI